MCITISGKGAKYLRENKKDIGESVQGGKRGIQYVIIA